MIPFDLMKIFKSRKYLQVLLQQCLAQKTRFTNHQLETRKTPPFILHIHRSLLKAFCSCSPPGMQADCANMAHLTQLLSLRTEKPEQEKAVLVLPCSIPQGLLLCFLTTVSTPSIHPLSQVFACYVDSRDKTN